MIDMSAKSPQPIWGRDVPGHTIRKGAHACLCACVFFCVLNICAYMSICVKMGICVDIGDHICKYAYLYICVYAEMCVCIFMC